MPANNESRESEELDQAGRQLLIAIGRRVREARAAKKLNQRRLAEEVGLQQSYVTAVENGVKNVTIMTLVRFADALGVSVRDFFPASPEELPSAALLQAFGEKLTELRPLIEDYLSTVRAQQQQLESMAKDADHKEKAAAGALGRLSEIHTAVETLMRAAAGSTIGVSSADVPR